ncbi:unnamed protein product, partial [Staurois parvus]
TPPLCKRKGWSPASDSQKGDILMSRSGSGSETSCYSSCKAYLKPAGWVHQRVTLGMTQAHLRCGV